VDDANQQFTVSVLGELEAQRESEEEKDPASEAAKHLKSVYKQIEETQKSAMSAPKKVRIDLTLLLKNFSPE
jgi:hypothetical protein